MIHQVLLSTTSSNLDTKVNGGFVRVRIDYFMIFSIEYLSKFYQSFFSIDSFREKVEIYANSAYPTLKNFMAIIKDILSTRKN
jgi:hypothetical protein